VLALAGPSVAQAASESLVTDDSPVTPFPQNKQNEPTVAIDPTDPSLVIAGSNDEIDEPRCGGSDCPFAQGIGNSGVYFSFNGGSSWTQPTYQGYSGRDGVGVGTSGCDGCGPGPIGTLPNYYENGLVSDGDPVVVFGPAPDSSGDFDWANGSRAYYSNLTSNFSTTRKDFTFKGFEAIAVSHTDDPSAAAGGDESAWSDPALVTKQNQSSATFSDKEDIAADNAATSPFFGNAYVCYSRFQSTSGPPVAIHVSRSTDGGDSWTKPHRLTASFDSPAQPGRQGCSIATDSEGVVYAIWEDTLKHHSVFMMDRSFDGGATWEKKPHVVAHVTDVGTFDGVRSISFDGIAGARTSSFPSLDIANGTPTGVGAPNTLALGWSDGADGLNHEHALVQVSGNQGRDWTDPTEVEQSGDRPDFAFISISPDGTDLYTVYDAFLSPFRNNTTATRHFQGVVRHSNVAGTTLSGTSTVHRGAIGDARASSANSLIDEFIGDYNEVDSTNDVAVAVWNDASNAAVCGAMNDFRQEVVDSGGAAREDEADERERRHEHHAQQEEPDAPAPLTDCPAKFGNTDIWSGVIADPTP
jgi:hypothetical protein